MKTFTISTVKANHNGYAMEFTALTSEGETKFDKSGYINDFKGEFELGTETIKSASFQDAFTILRLKRDAASELKSRINLRNKLNSLEKAVLTVFETELKGVQRRTKLNNLFAKAEKIEARKARQEARKIAKIQKANEVFAAARKAKDIAVLESYKIVSVSTNPTERLNNCGTPFTENTYHGCGKYWVAVKNGLIQASVMMGDSPIDNFQTYREYAKEKLAAYGTVISGEGSGTQFFCNNSEDLDLFNDEKIYNVPAPNGDGNLGFNHTNFQAL